MSFFFYIIKKQFKIKNMILGNLVQVGESYESTYKVEHNEVVFIQVNTVGDVQLEYSIDSEYFETEDDVLPVPVTTSKLFIVEFAKKGLFIKVVSSAEGTIVIL